LSIPLEVIFKFQNDVAVPSIYGPGGYAINFQTPRFMIPVGTAKAPSTSNIANSSSTSALVTWNFRVVLKAWGLEKTCRPPKN